MAGNIKGITIEIGGNTTPLQKALSGVNKSIKDTQKQLKEVDKLLKVDPKNVELLRQKQDLLNKAVSDTKDKLDKEKEALKQLAAQDKTPEVTEKMNQLQRAIAEDEQALKSANKELKQFGSVGKQEAMATAKQFEETGKKIQEVGKKISDVGQGLTTHVTAPIVAVGAASMAAFNEVDSAYDTVIKKTGATGEAAQGLYDIVDNLATSIPTDFDTAANAVGEVNTRFGLTGDELEDLAGQFVKFADLNNTDVSTSIDLVQSAMAAFGVETEDAADVLDILNKAGQDTGVPLDQLAASLTTNGTALQEMGFGINESVGFLANLDKSGVDSASVMTGLKKALQNATKDGKSMGDALSELQDDLENTDSDTEAAQKAMELFGNKAGPAIAQAVRDGRLSFDELSATVTDWGDSVNDTFNETLDPIDQWQMTMNDLKLAGAEVGSVIGELLAPMLQKAADVIRDLKQKWDELSPGTQQAIVAAAGVLAVVGPIVMLIGSLVTGIGGLITSVGAIATALGVSVGVIGGVVAAIAALIAIIVLCITHWDDIKAKVKEVWNSITTYVTNLKEDVSAKWEEMKQNVADKIQSIKTDLQEKWAQIKSDAVQKIEDMKNDAIQKFVDLKDGIKKKIEDIKGFFKDLVLKIPKPELPSLPSFSLKTASKTILGKEITYPVGFDIDWNAIAMNTPKLFTSPTVMQTPYGMLGAGEAGHEIMYGYNNLMRDIQNATAANNDSLLDGMYSAFVAALQQADLTIELNGRELGRAMREARA